MVSEGAAAYAFDAQNLLISMTPTSTNKYNNTTNSEKEEIRENPTPSPQQQIPPSQDEARSPSIVDDGSSSDDDRSPGRRNNKRAGAGVKQQVTREVQHEEECLEAYRIERIYGRLIKLGIIIAYTLLLSNFLFSVQSTVPHLKQ